MFTLVARPKIDPPSLSALPQRVAESIALALNEEFGLASALKDPNDVMVAGRKICGVLCTSKVVAEQVEWVLCGVGLNTAMGEHELPAAATSLACERIAAPANECILPLLLRRLEWLRDA